MEKSNESLRVSILKYLEENNGLDGYVDLIPPFKDQLTTIEDRLKFKTILSILAKDGLIEISRASHYRLLPSHTAGGVLTPLWNHSAIVRLRHRISDVKEGGVSFVIKDSPGAQTHIGDDYSSLKSQTIYRDIKTPTNNPPKKQRSIISQVLVGLAITLLSTFILWICKVLFDLFV